MITHFSRSGSRWLSHHSPLSPSWSAPGNLIQALVKQYARDLHLDPAVSGTIVSFSKGRGQTALTAFFSWPNRAGCHDSHKCPLTWLSRP